ncbi:BREX-1 system adenine-specific DNA-methyltransferase PglX [Laspinema olomoucense]|uniref:BREX-1 system adenine-specific DNA-methyltransferase PglX n=1 Tax=Laspinema olomoucense TaxID=3231600 RepID=UPI0021BAC992|nr:BREX-1 system adenine-specific DNA-methyltransferase PglX [Laspinema sp. D3d]MCT7971123.1 BREX-1 system adenine-specific DNA-methyltransferase PglX [Laspinema sp. D3d]
MPERLLQLDDLRTLESPEGIASLFHKLGYNAQSESLDVSDLQLSPRNVEAIYDAHLIANQGNSDLQIFLFQLHEEEWVSPSTASSRLRAIASQLGKRDTEFLLLATKDYNQLMLVNPRKAFDDKINVKASVRKLLIDRTNPTAYDRDRLEAIAVRGQTPKELYETQCEAFDVDKLTKSFYRGYKDLFERVQALVKEWNEHPYFEDNDRLHQFSQRLLGRIMFLYFLQKKEFLAGDRKFLTTQYRLLETEPDETDYYSEVLEPLFFETLNKERPNFESRWDGKIPYLNGGLFDRDYGEGIRDPAGRETPSAIALPNSLFDPGESSSILGFFNSYNFTISENVAGDEDVAVDPEMLGKVFENMLAAEERGQSGTFYTPRGIVNFMCAEVLSRYLADESGMDLETIRHLIEYDPDLPDAEFNKLMTPQQARTLKRAITTIKVLDPAVGSGAFPLGMMQTILAVRQAIARREGMLVQRGSLTISQWKRDIIANNLYGVDIKPGAIEIAKLRMWLSLVVDIPDIDDVEPLPNLDYKLMCGDSLISTIHGEHLIPDPTKEQQLALAVTPIQQAISPLLELQHRYFSAQSAERQQLREQILEAEANVFRVAVADRRQFWVSKQQDLERKIQTMKGKVTKAQEKERATITEKLAELDSFAAEVTSGERSLNFFQYHLHFRDVFTEKSGFDVVIGNPPYVRQEEITDIKTALELEYECFKRKADLYIYFYEQGIKVLNENGLLTYITPNKYFRAPYGDKIRNFLLKQCDLKFLIDFGDTHIFDAIAYPSILQVQKNKVIYSYSKILIWNKIYDINSLKIIFDKYSFNLDLSQDNSNLSGWKLLPQTTISILNKIKNSGNNLENYINRQFYHGIKTGYNDAFIVDAKTRDKLISENFTSKNILKPLIRGRNIKKWNVDYQNEWIIFTVKGTDLTKFPAIHNHLINYKNRLIPGIAGGRLKGNYEWYEIFHTPVNWKDFESPKILYQEIMTYQSFTLDECNFYPNNKVFIIPSASKYLLGLLNSKIIWFFLHEITPKLQGGALMLQTSYIKQIPIPTAPEAERLAIEALVQKCLNAKGQGVEEWESEIDDRVSHLYGLTDEDMKIIRGE